MIETVDQHERLPLTGRRHTCVNKRIAAISQSLIGTCQVRQLDGAVCVISRRHRFNRDAIGAARRHNMASHIKRQRRRLRP